MPNDLRRSVFGLPRLRNVLKKQALVIFAVLLWVPAVTLGLSTLLRYSNTPGRLATPPGEWPHGATKSTGQPSLVLFLHPQCPCSRATIAELAQIMARCRGKVAAYAYFYAPRSESSSWTRSDLWADAASIPGVHAVDDPDGIEARRFGASTSGQTLLYDSSGRLAFNGGITAARGHMGPNDGQDAVVALLENRTPQHHITPVFGCSLLGPG